MGDNLQDAIRMHISRCNAAVDQAMMSHTVDEFHVRQLLEDLEYAKRMEQEPTLFLDMQRKLYLVSTI